MSLTLPLGLVGAAAGLTYGYAWAPGFYVPGRMEQSAFADGHRAAAPVATGWTTTADLSTPVRLTFGRLADGP
jgi:hypothetical protein